MNQRWNKCRINVTIWSKSWSVIVTNSIEDYILYASFFGFFCWIKNLRYVFRRIVHWLRMFSSVLD